MTKEQLMREVARVNLEWFESGAHRGPYLDTLIDTEAGETLAYRELMRQYAEAVHS